MKTITQLYNDFVYGKTTVAKIDQIIEKFKDLANAITERDLPYLESLQCYEDLNTIGNYLKALKQRDLEFLKWLENNTI